MGPVELYPGDCGDCGGAGPWWFYILAGLFVLRIPLMCVIEEIREWLEERKENK